MNFLICRQEIVGNYMNSQNCKEIILQIKVQPNAKKTELVSRQGDSLKIRVAAPPEEGKANDALIKFLAKLFDIPRSSIEIISGKTTKLKRVKLKFN